MRDDFVKYKIKDFSKHKEEIINLICMNDGGPLLTNIEKISKTDWNINEQTPYKNYIIKNIMDDYIKNLKQLWYYERIIVENMWFQLYDKGDFHDLHNHGRCHFANVLYIKLPLKKLKTNIISFNGKLIDVDVEEGDILTFPAYLKHQSPVNTTNEEKIVISFNINVE